MYSIHCKINNNHLNHKSRFFPELCCKRMAVNRKWRKLEIRKLSPIQSVALENIYSKHDFVNTAEFESMLILLYFKTGQGRDSLILQIHWHYSLSEPMFNNWP